MRIAFLTALLFSTLGLQTQAQVHSNDPLYSSPKSWDYDSAAHLLRRAGFGGTPGEIQHLVELGRDGAVDSLLQYEKIPFEVAEPKISKEDPRAEMMKEESEDADKKALQVFRRVNEQIQFRNLSEWLFERMVLSPRPLEEKLVLFWHGHFTSGMKEVKDPYRLYQQDELLRKYASGNFRTLLQQISRDAAMLRYLDTDRNLKNKPNENYARELMELFTMGVGNYTEQDVKEAARAFTGWTADPGSREFLVRQRQHDANTKTIFGVKGTFDGDGVIELILKQPVTAEFISKKVWKFFAGTEPSEALLRSLAQTLRKNDYELKPLLRVIFRSDAFYSPETRFQIIKSPVELVVGSFHLLEIKPQNLEAFVEAMKSMGQELFQPPNVKGWDGGVKWIDASSLFTRYNVGQNVIYGCPAPKEGRAQRLAKMEMLPEGMELNPRNVNRDQPPYNPIPVLRETGVITSEQIVDHFVKRLLQQTISEEERALLVEHLQKLGGKLNPHSEKTSEAIRGVIHLILSTPEYQVS